MLLNLVIHNNLPFSIVRSTALKILLEEVANRTMKMPSINYTMQTLSTKFTLMKQNMKFELEKTSNVCVTTDVWTHRCRSYLGVSAHFIDSQNPRIRKSMILSFKRLKQRQTFDYLALCLKEVFDEYDLPIRKITHVVTDGGSNFCKAFRVYGTNDDFSKSMAAFEECREIDEDDNFEEEDVVVVEDNTVVILEDNDLEKDETVTQNQILQDIQNAALQFDQINFPDDQYDDSTFIEISLPRQMRCFSHLLNLIGNISSK